ncbi:MAG: hypothetical protein LBC89_06460, partial [Bacteroidales bacterium]|nr:hypothetical protein [Bacteroidales bacterium]
MKYILFFTLFIISANLLAQRQDDNLFSNEEFFKNSDYILEIEPANIQSVCFDAKGDYKPEDLYTSS